MRDPIENVTRLQKQLNNLQLENQVLKNILDKAGLSYQNELASIRKTDTKEDFDPEQGKRIVHPKEITDRMAKLFFSSLSVIIYSSQVFFSLPASIPH